ncbi:hypothetical protein ACI79D_13795 [Geodermatophilus sp. SYSU D00708]
MRADEEPVPVGLPTLRAWRRTGLLLSGAALACFAGFIAATVASDARPLAAVPGVAAFVCALLALGFLRRAWSDPGVRHAPRVIRARRLSEATMTAWTIAIIPHWISAVSPNSAESLRWLSAVSFVLGCVAVAAFIAMLAVAVRCNPQAR